MAHFGTIETATNAWQFSLRRTLFVVFAFAVGFTIARMPTGQWIDAPVFALATYFAAALVEQAATLRLSMATRTGLPHDVRNCSRLLMGIVIALALTLLAAVVLRTVEANRLPDDPIVVNSRYWVPKQPALPRDLAMFAMLVTLGLNSWRRPPAKPRWRQRIYLGLAVPVVFVGIMRYAADFNLIVFLVYLGISGIEMYESPKFLSKGLNPNTAVRQATFANASLMALPLAAANFILLFAVIGCWKRRRLRFLLLACLAMGIAAEFLVVQWIAMRGVWQLSPAMSESVGVALVPGCLIGAMVVWAAIGFSWRLLARPATLPVPAEEMRDEIRESEHASSMDPSLPGSENRFVAVLVGLVALVEIIIELTGAAKRPAFSGAAFTFDNLCRAFLQDPMNFLWLAAAIAGFALALRRRAVAGDPLPTIDLPKFFTLAIALLALTLLAAPIIAAASFSLWLVRFPGTL